MNKLHKLTILTVISILGLSTINTSHADSTIADNQNKRYIKIAQNSNSATPETEDEMIEAIQKRDKKIEAFKDMLKIDGIVPEVNTTNENSIDTGDEMMDALQKRQQKIEKLKELKQVQDKLNNQKINDLQEQNIDVQNAEELQKIQAIINNDNLNNEQIIDALQKQNINIDSIEKLEKNQKIINAGKSAAKISDSGKMSAKTAFRLFAIGIPGTILVFLIGTPLVKGFAEVFKSNYQKRFGKPPIPDRSLNLHNKAFKEVSRHGKQAVKIDDDKFGNEEFKALIHYKINIAKGVEGYKELDYKVELLRAAIIAQKSFLKLEATELRYRSRRQQQFYQYIADNLEEDLDKNAFAQKIKDKQAEILPLINTEQGKEAIHAYTREINDISKHELGLKLLALFKKYDLKDFSIIREISEVVEGLQGHNLS